MIIVLGIFWIFWGSAKNENINIVKDDGAMEAVISKSHMDVYAKVDIVKFYMDAPAGLTVPKQLLDEGDDSSFFSSQEISNSIFQRIYGKSYKEDCTVSRTDLRYVRVLHMGFDGEVHTGELIVNATISEDILKIFYELFKAGYPIEKMHLIDDYDGDDALSMTDNNTSGFNYRVIQGSDVWSNHSKGLAVDVNPLYNPCVKMVDGETVCEPAAAAAYTEREQDFDHKIDEHDLCYEIFTKYGFSWGGSWEGVKDYQHFEKT